MSESRSFDRAVDTDDQTCLLLEPIAKNGIEAIFDLMGDNRRVLDVGTGTGRISVPLLERGVDLIGCDLSEKMPRRLQEKLPSRTNCPGRCLSSPLPKLSF